MPMTDNDTDTKPLHGPNLILDVENFGPIAEAKNIEFRPMTVFVGPSNTGKSYLAMLLHAMSQALGQGRQDLNFWRLGIPYGRLNGIDVQGLAMEIASAVNANIDPSKSNPLDEKYIELPVSGLTEQGRREFDGLTDNVFYHVLDLIRKTVREYFEVNDELELTNDFVAKATQSSVALRQDSESGSAFRILSIESDHLRYELSKTDLTDYANMVPRFFFPEHIGLEIHEFVRDHVPRQYVFGIVDNSLPRLESHYLPASRTGIMVSHATLTDRIIANASRLSIEGSDLVPFHRIHAEFLRAVNSVRHSSPTNRDSEHDALMMAERLEASVLGGMIGVAGGSTGLPRFFYGREDSRIPLFRSSSMVTELAPLVLFLRHYLSAGDLLIVEEPESHLHPMAQQQLAGLLTLMIRSGFRILITTHSHYMVEAMGMFTCAAGIDADARSKSMRLLNNGGDDMDRDLYLNPNEVAVYSFDPQGSVGTRVRQVPYDPQSYAFVPEGYSTALLDQFNRISRVVNARIDVDELA